MENTFKISDFYALISYKKTLHNLIGFLGLGIPILSYCNQYD